MPGSTSEMCGIIKRPRPHHEGSRHEGSAGTLRVTDLTATVHAASPALYRFATTRLSMTLLALSMMLPLAAVNKRSAEQGLTMPKRCSS